MKTTVSKVLTTTAVFAVFAWLSAGIFAANRAQKPVNWQNARRSYEEFLKKPSSSHAKALMRTLPPRNAVDPNDPELKETLGYLFEGERYARFEAIVRKARPAYIQLAFGILDISDEDNAVLIEALIGSCITAAPEAFLRSAANATEFQLRGIMGNYTGELAEDHLIQAQELKARRAALEKVKKKKYSKIKKDCLDLIDVFIEERESMKIQGE